VVGFLYRVNLLKPVCSFFVPAHTSILFLFWFIGVACFVAVVLFHISRQLRLASGPLPTTARLVSSAPHTFFFFFSLPLFWMCLAGGGLYHFRL